MADRSIRDPAASYVSVLPCRPGRRPHCPGLTLPTDPAHDQVSTLTEHGQPGVATRPRLTLSAAAEACAVSRSTLRRRLAQGAFPNAVRDADGTWMVPVGDLLAAGLRINAPRVSSEQDQPAVSRVSGPVHRLPAGPGEQGHGGEGEREGAERLVAERAARIEDLRVSLRMLEAAPRTGAGDGGPSRWRRWWR